MKNNLNHIALILDGNKRWAKKNNKSNILGYTKGLDNIKNLVKSSLSNSISYLTIFALSTENFKRSSLNIIYDLIYKNFNKILDEIIKDHDVKIKIFGSKENLPKKILEIFENIENTSSNNRTLNLNIGFNYGFKNEIRKILEKVKDKNFKINLDDQEDINKLFNIGNIPDPDLLIRTGGYQRLSNFIMYNLTYTELFFTKTLWPDFTEAELNLIINEYLNIKRKYGL